MTETLTFSLSYIHYIYPTHIYLVSLQGFPACHLLYMNHVIQLLSHVRLFCNLMDCSPQASLSMGFPGKNSRVGCHFLLQGIFPIRGWNSELLHWQADSLPLSHQGSPSHNSHVLLALKFIEARVAVLGNLPPCESIYLQTNTLLPFICQFCTNELTIFADVLFLFLRKVSYFLVKKLIPFLGYSIKNIFICKSAVSLSFSILSLKVSFSVYL